MPRDRQAFALERRWVGKRARVGDRDAVRVEAQVVAAVVLRVELRPLGHRLDVVDRRLDGPVRSVRRLRSRSVFDGHGWAPGFGRTEAVRPLFGYLIS